MKNQALNVLVVWSAVFVGLGSCSPIFFNDDDVFHLFDVPTVFRRRRSLPSQEGEAAGPGATRLAQGLEAAMEQHNDDASKHELDLHNHAEANNVESKHEENCEHHVEANNVESKHEEDCDHHTEGVHVEHVELKHSEDVDDCTDPDHHHEKKQEEDCAHDTHDVISETNHAQEKDGHAHHVMVEFKDAPKENEESCTHDTNEGYHQVELHKHDDDCHEHHEMAESEGHEKDATTKHVHHIVHRSRDTEFEPELDKDFEILNPKFNEVQSLDEVAENGIKHGLYSRQEANRVADLTFGLPLEAADEIIRADKNEHSRRRGAV